MKPETYLLAEYDNYPEQRFPTPELDQVFYEALLLICRRTIKITEQNETLNNSTE